MMPPRQHRCQAAIRLLLSPPSTHTFWPCPASFLIGSSPEGVMPPVPSVLCVQALQRPEATPCQGLQTPGHIASPLAAQEFSSLTHVDHLPQGL